MKNLNKYLLITVALVCVLITSAFASEYDKTAQELKDIGLFQGTTAGFDLDRAPTRTEAAVMLVRMLGAENQAKTDYAAGKITNPFTDVPDWADPYIAWLYSKNLAKGVSDTAFGANGQCTAKMYCTFVLRALGYSDASGGDFTFDEAESFAEDAGIFSTSIVEDTFLRDHAVFISYEALAANLNGSSKTLLEKLISDGSVSATNASTLLNKVKAYDACESAYDKWMEQDAADMTVNESYQFSSTKLNMKMNYTSKRQSKVIITNNDIKVESIISIIDGDNTMTSSRWIKDGYVFVKSGSQKYKYFAGEDDVDDILYSEYRATKPTLFYMQYIDNISSTSSGSDTVYNMTIRDYQMDLDMIESIFDNATVKNATVKSYTITFTVDANGMVKNTTERIDYTITAEVDGQTADFNCEYVYNSAVNAVGNAVSIQYPDFTDYLLQ